MKTISFFLIWVLTGCVKAPEIIPGLGSVYGILEANAHRSILNKSAFSDENSVYSISGKNREFAKKMIDYHTLTGLFAGIIKPAHSPQQHKLVATETGFSHKSLALAPGDSLLLSNLSHKKLNFFIINRNDSDAGFQSFPELAPGQQKKFSIQQTGELELLADEDERYKMHILSKTNLLAVQLSSNQPYQFTHLTPGPYQLYFWHWRLGLIKKEITIHSESNHRLDIVLSVDRIIQ